MLATHRSNWRRLPPPSLHAACDCVPGSSIGRWTPRKAKSEEVEPETVGTIESFDGSSWQRIVEAMVAVVHSPRGTAKRINDGIAYRMAGKTGTAQVFTIGQNEKYDAEKLDKKLHDHGSSHRVRSGRGAANRGCRGSRTRWKWKQGGGTARPHRDRRLPRRYTRSRRQPERRTLRTAASDDAVTEPAAPFPPVPG